MASHQAVGVQLASDDAVAVTMRLHLQCNQGTTATLGLGGAVFSLCACGAHHLPDDGSLTIARTLAWLRQDYCCSTR